jgi:excinuclease UvrABC nuclease subunit
MTKDETQEPIIRWLPPPKVVASGSFEVPSSEGAYVYHAYSESKELLYVGRCTELLLRRLGQHQAARNWMTETARIEWYRYQTELESRFAEGEDIRQFSPRYNRQR